MTIKKPTILFDLDGTLADIGHRRIYLEQTSPNWKLFNAEIERDVPNKPIVDLYQTLWDSAKYELIIITGRSEDQRPQTESWLNSHGIPFLEIKMRMEGDYRADHIIKEELLVALLQTGKNILFVVDDRDQVVQMWRRHGLTCLQCAEGNF